MGQVKFVRKKDYSHLTPRFLDDVVAALLKKGMRRVFWKERDVDWGKEYYLGQGIIVSKELATVNLHGDNTYEVNISDIIVTPTIVSVARTYATRTDVNFEIIERV